MQTCSWVTSTFGGGIIIGRSGGRLSGTGLGDGMCGGGNGGGIQAGGRSLICITWIASGCKRTRGGGPRLDPEAGMHAPQHVLIRIVCVLVV